MEGARPAAGASGNTHRKHGPPPAGWYRLTCPSHWLIAAATSGLPAATQAAFTR
jgi:hypothetical protein